MLFDVKVAAQITLRLLSDTKPVLLKILFSLANSLSPKQYRRIFLDKLTFKLCQAQ